MQGAQDLVAGERRFHGDIGRFVVSNFTHHHDVRVLAQDRTQGRGKIESDLAAHRNLIDAGQLVLDRVLDRHDVVLRVIQLLQHRVKRRRFARAGRPGHQNHSMRRVDRLAKFFQRPFLQTHLVDAARERRFIEETHDDFFPMRRGQKRDAQIDLFTAQL